MQAKLSHDWRALLCDVERITLSWVFLQHFRPYLLGRKFTLRTDHGSLNWLANFRQLEGQLARWLERLQEYEFVIQHRPGRKHQNADAQDIPFPWTDAVPSMIREWFETFAKSHNTA